MNSDHEYFMTTHFHLGKIGLLAFANESPILIEEAWNSKYIAVFDPLDGSTNIDVGIVTGMQLMAMGMAMDMAMMMKMGVMIVGEMVSYHDDGGVDGKNYRSNDVRQIILYGHEVHCWIIINALLSFQEQYLGYSKKKRNVYWTLEKSSRTKILLLGCCRTFSHHET